jgi:ribosomal peptide maturation radical SAM protein 1
MPFASATRPSIQLGLLSAIAEAAGFPVDTHYFNLDLAAELTPQLYELFCQHRGHMTGDWLFGVAAFGASDAMEAEAYLQTFPHEQEWAESMGKDGAFLSNLRSHILPRFIERCVSAIDWSQYNLVGFSSTFQQNVASLALARAIKTRFPAVHIVFGGANMEGEMGTEVMRAFPYVDFVVSGEGDSVFPALLRAFERDESIEHLQGVVWRRSDGEVVGGQSLPIEQLDELPIPNYYEYFRRADELHLLADLGPGLMLPFESSRGCWWGAKHHCTFCGLNGVGMGFRKKTADRVMMELSELSARHAVTAFEAVDNILSLNYVDSFFGRLAHQKIDFRFFYEVKSNLTREKIRILANGGVRHIQPGIESMSTRILKLMRKGCTMLQNVLCLKWCRYYGVRASWNLLVGFPGETDLDYSGQLQVLKSISHLEPPQSCGRIWLERFSPYYTDGDVFGVLNRRPSRSYSFVYPEYVDLTRLAYFFDYEMLDTLPHSAHASTEAWIEQWNEQWRSDRRHILSYRRTPNALFIDYDRGPEDTGTYRLPGALAMMYEYCSETMRTPRSVQRHLIEVLGQEFFVEEIRKTLMDFCEDGLMLGEDDLFLSLAIPANRNF